eukprot:scaffold1146_cov399-Prasinococcus_capsulatus_cf.AAC.10
MDMTYWRKMNWCSPPYSAQAPVDTLAMLLKPRHVLEPVAESTVYQEVKNFPRVELEAHLASERDPPEVAVANESL